jgi:heme oxygenase (biliverdin-IX-beta and delta-forming)
MLLEKIPAPGGAGGSARAALRLATDSTHHRMHGLDPFARIAEGRLPVGQYRSLLQSLFRFHSAVGRAARQSGWRRISSALPRLALLRSDLDFLGGEVPGPADWHPGTGEAVLGALYAAEGSMLGGRVIARQLDYVFGSGQPGRRFFIGDKQDGKNWSRLLAVLEETCARPPALDAAIRGALGTFDWFEQCVTVPVDPPVLSI